MGMSCGDSGFQVALAHPCIHAITREVVQDQKVCLDRVYYKWTIRFNFPADGRIAFGASGFTQRLRAKPVLSNAQRLSSTSRVRLGDTEITA